MKTWQITVKIGDEPQDNLELIDINEVLEGYLNITRTFFDELLNIVKMIKKYVIGKGLEKIIGPDNKDWTKNPWLLLMIKDNEKNIPFWIIIPLWKRLADNLSESFPQPGSGKSGQLPVHFY